MEVKVTGQTGDGGIDGHGVLQMNELVSFRVVFQCKRYAGSVGPGMVRDFRGGAGTGTDKAILLSTGSLHQERAGESRESPAFSPSNSSTASGWSNSWSASNSASVRARCSMWTSGSLTSTDSPERISL